MRKPKSKGLYISAAAAITLLGGGAVAYGAGVKTVSVQDNGQRKLVRGFSTGSLDEFLKQNGVTVNTGDRVTVVDEGHEVHSLSEPVQDGMQVMVEHPKHILLNDAGKTENVSSFASTVSGLLQQEQIQLGHGISVDEHLNSNLKNGETIHIHHTDTMISVRTEDVPFQTLRRRTDHLYSGQQRVLTYGVKGSLETKTTAVYRDGHKVHVGESKKVVKQPVTQVIEVGTAERPVYVRSSSAQLSSRSGGERSRSFSGSMTVLATAYTAGGLTYTGQPAQPGVVAVDPSVIPLGTKMYIPGVGVVTAADTGGAINGRHIDICMSSQSAAEAWGERTLTVYFLN